MALKLVDEDGYGAALLLWAVCSCAAATSGAFPYYAQLPDLRAGNYCSLSQVRQVKNFYQVTGNLSYGPPGSLGLGCGRLRVKEITN